MANEERHHAATGVAHVELQQVLRLQALSSFCLHGDALHASGVREVVDVGRAEIGGDRAVDVGEGDAECVGLLAVDDQQQLCRIRHAFDAGSGDQGFCAILPINSSVAFFRASWPLPLRSCRRKVKPLLVPKPSIGGGDSAKVAHP
jgi:hypothetical protein